jgi:hypothetical protein
MAINGHRNKPIGPGGSTRRLHHQLIVTGCEVANRAGQWAADGGELASTKV